MIVVLGPDPRMRGGIASVLAHYRDGGLLDRLDARLVPTSSPGSRARKLARLFGCAIELARLVLQGGVDGAHVHVATGVSLWRKALLIRALRVVRVPVLLHIHAGAFFDRYDAGGIAYRACLRATLRASARIVVLSEEWCGRCGAIAPAVPVEVITNPVRLPARVVAPRDDGTVRLLFLGRLTREKGVFDLLHAFARARAALGTEMRLVVGGIGALDEVRRLGASLGIADRVDTVGWIDGDAKRQRLDECDVVVLPSYIEGQPVAVLEAMAHGRAVIATRVGGVPEVIEHQGTGWLVAPGDVDGIAQAIVALARDASERARLGTEGRRRAEARYDLRVVEMRLGRAYGQLRKLRPLKDAATQRDA